MIIPIIQKGSYLTSVSPNGEDFDTSFTIKNSKGKLFFDIKIYALDEDVVNTWDLKELTDEREFLYQFPSFYAQCSYPIVVKVRLSQTQSYKFCVEYGPNESTGVISIQDTILLKTNHGQYQT
ncbi:unnamed protein product [Mucor hiemalis]